MNGNQHQAPEKRLHFIEQKIDKMSDENAEIEKKLDRVLIYMIGDGQDKTNPGILIRVKKLEERIEKLEKWKSAVIYFVIGLSFAGGWGINSLIEWFTHLK